MTIVIAAVRQLNGISDSRMTLMSAPLTFARPIHQKIFEDEAAFARGERAAAAYARQLAGRTSKTFWKNASSGVHPCRAWQWGQ
jgi:hypothetical protein